MNFFILKLIIFLSEIISKPQKVILILIRQSINLSEISNNSLETMILSATDLSFVIVLCNEINPFNLEKIKFNVCFLFIYFLQSNENLKSRLLTKKIDIIKSKIF